MRFFLPRVLHTYHQRYPRIVVRVIDQGATDALAAVARHEVDFALNQEGAQSSQLAFVPMLKERFVLACQPTHPLARKTEVRWSELADFDYMAVAKASSNRYLVDMALTDLPVKPRWFCETQHVSTLVDLVEAGVGIAAVPEMCMPRGRHAGLVSVPLVEPAISRTVGLVHSVGRKLPPAAQHLYDQILTMQGAPS
jgi:DNA-binding transcriptional LysR family regulator